MRLNIRSLPITMTLSGRASAFRAFGTLSGSSRRAFTSSSRLEVTETYKGFDTIALHGGYTPDTETVYGMGHGAPRGVPLYRTTPFVFKNSDHAADLFALKELGNIYSRLMNPTNHVLESRYSQLEGAHEMAGLSVASGTNAIFYAILTLAEAGDNIVASSQLYGGTYT
jgi:O-acetylhomoserine (thiol)-lyase